MKPQVAKCPPHARGGAPTARRGRSRTPSSSPRTWGCSVRSLRLGLGGHVLPTHVGVLRLQRSPSSTCLCPPHARGGAPVAPHIAKNGVGSSPRTWGCSGGAEPATQRLLVLPTHVGVLPRRRSRPSSRRGPPHARGGAPRVFTGSTPGRVSSPRTWGCSVGRLAGDDGHGVLPTHVGVLHRRGTTHPTTDRPPHARGGAPEDAPTSVIETMSSPRTWGCSGGCPDFRDRDDVLPTHVGVLRPALG